MEVKKWLILVLLVYASFMPLHADEQTKKLNDWCTLSYPSEIDPMGRRKLFLRVKLGPVKDGLNLRFDLYYFKGKSEQLEDDVDLKLLNSLSRVPAVCRNDSNVGFLAWWGPAVKAIRDKEYILGFNYPLPGGKFNLPQSLEGITSIRALIFLSKDGDYKNATQQVWSPAIITVTDAKKEK